MVITFCENLLVKLRERRVVYEDRLLSGSLNTMEEYSRVIGKLEGLKESESELSKLYSDMYEPKRKKEEIYDEPYE